ncbi:hypothetical protein BZA77DRAFT_373488 [Pyronema omphalodes]|nr:hypothetical protein BZA77DRAFT_373488 [Pyronema omphalodes]
MNAENRPINKNAVTCVLRIPQQYAFDSIDSTAPVNNINFLPQSVESQYSTSPALGDQFKQSINSQRVHEETTEFARSVLADMVMAIPVTSNYSAETVSSFSSINDEKGESALTKYRYSPYFLQGVPSRHRVRFDCALDWIRVKLFRREPISCDTRHKDNILRDAMKAKYSPRGKCSAIKLNLRRWSLSPEERDELCEKYRRWYYGNSSLL